MVLRYLKLIAGLLSIGNTNVRGSSATDLDTAIAIKKLSGTSLVTKLGCPSSRC